MSLKTRFFGSAGRRGSSGSDFGPFTSTRMRALVPLLNATVTGTYIMKLSGTPSCTTVSFTRYLPSPVGSKRQVGL